MKRLNLIAAAALALACLGPLGGCAMLNRNNTRLLNLYERAVLPPEDSALRAWTSPLTVPGGWLCIALDAGVIHPVCTLDDAAIDAANLFTDVWSRPQWSDHYTREAMALPWRVIGSVTAVPAVGLGSWAGRWVLDMDPAKRRTKPETLDPEVRRLREQRREVERFFRRERSRYVQMHKTLRSFGSDKAPSVCLAIFEASADGGAAGDGAALDLGRHRGLERLLGEIKRTDIEPRFTRAEDPQPLRGMLILRARGEALIVLIDDAGFSLEGREGCFACPQLAALLKEVLADSLSDPQRCPQVSAALDAAAVGETPRKMLLEKFGEGYRQAIDECLKELGPQLP